MKKQNITVEWHRLCVLFNGLLNYTCYGSLFICDSGSFNHCNSSGVKLSGFKT